MDMLFIPSEMLTFLVAFTSSNATVLQRLNNKGNISWLNRKIHYIDGESNKN